MVVSVTGTLDELQSGEKTNWIAMGRRLIALPHKIVDEIAAGDPYGFALLCFLKQWRGEQSSLCQRNCEQTWVEPAQVQGGSSM
jgi:hypothetical protein